MGNGGYWATYFVNCTALFSNVSTVKLKSLWYSEYVFWARETRNKSRTLQWISSGRYLFGRCRRRLENNTKLNFWEVNYEYMNWIWLNWFCTVLTGCGVISFNYQFQIQGICIFDAWLHVYHKYGFRNALFRNPMPSTWQTTTEHSLLLAFHHSFLLVLIRLKLR
jgi:hypothetical protein